MAKSDQRRRVCSCSVSSETRLRRCRSDPNRCQPQTDRLLSSAGIAEQSPTSSVVLCSDLPGGCISRISAARPRQPQNKLSIGWLLPPPSTQIAQRSCPWPPQAYPLGFKGMPAASGIDPIFISSPSKSRSKRAKIAQIRIRGAVGVTTIPGMPRAPNHPTMTPDSGVSSVASPAGREEYHDRSAAGLRANPRRRATRSHAATREILQPTARTVGKPPRG